MKKFQFTLERLLNFKNQVLDKEKDQLAVIRAQKAEVDQRILRYEAAIQTLSEQMLEEQKKGSTIIRLQFYSVQIENARKCLVALRREQAALEKEVDRQAEVVVKASREVSSLEKLRDKQLETYQYEEKRAQEAENLETITKAIVRKQHTA